MRALTNALSSERLHHAYLFTGTRGVGKTTVARVFAKCLNCETGVVGNPCGECSACKEITEGRFVDLIEIDAASRTRVEDMRELLDNVQYRPTRARFKVYLIDEVHMLSNSSFNALLKTLEEPPEHVKFLLATTDPQKLPVTVLSRCLQFNLKQLSVERIRSHLQDLMAREGVVAEEGALRELARAAQGSMRDALSLTDQAISFGGGELRSQDVADMLGTVDRQYVWGLLEALLIEDRVNVLKRGRALAQFSPDYNDVLQGIAEALYALALEQMMPGVESEAAVEPDRLRKLASLQPPAAIQLLYQIALLCRRDLALSPDPQIGFEMALLRMLAFQPAAGGLPVGGKSTIPGPGIREPVQNLPAADSSEAPVAEPQESADKEPAPTLSVATPVAPPTVEAPSQEPVARDQASETSENADLTQSVDIEASERDLAWEALLQNLGATGILRAILLHAECVRLSDTELVLRVDNSQQGILNQSHPEKVRKLFAQNSGQEVAVSLELGAIEGKTPAMLARERQQRKQALAEQSIESDPNVRWICEQFAGTILENATRPVRPDSQ